MESWSRVDARSEVMEDMVRNGVASGRSARWWEVVCVGLTEGVGYSASRGAALVMFTKTLESRERRWDIRITMLCPWLRGEVEVSLRKDGEEAGERWSLIG